MVLGAKALLVGVPVVAGLAALAFSKPASAAPGAAPGAPPPAPLGGAGAQPGGVAPVFPAPVAPPGQVPIGALGPGVPQAIVDEVAGALVSGDPDKMVAAANDIQAKGFPQVAADLRATAAVTAQAIKSAQLPPQVPQSSPGQPAVPSPAVPIPVVPVGLPPVAGAPPGGVPFAPPPIQLPPMVIPGVAPGAPPLPVDPRMALAQSVALHLASVTRGHENKALISQFEVQEDQAGFIPDHDTRGLYGAHDALALANHWNIVPPAPFYWPHNATPAKKQFQDAMRAKAAADPARAAQWLQAATASQFT